MRTIKLAVVLLILLVVVSQVVQAWTQRESRRESDSIADLEERAARQPGNADLQSQLGRAYFNKARLGNSEAADKAVAVLERKLNGAPADISSARWLGLSHFAKVACLSESGAPAAGGTPEMERPLAAFDRVLDKAPRDAIGLASHGSALVFMARYKRSLELLRKGTDEMNRAVAANPSDENPR